VLLLLCSALLAACGGSVKEKADAGAPDESDEAGVTKPDDDGSEPSHDPDGQPGARDAGVASKPDAGGNKVPDAGSSGVPDAGSSSGASSAAEVARKLGRDHFLIGLGNDLDNDHDKDGAYTLGVSLDVHYAYLVGLKGAGGWPDWNADGSFANILTDSAKRHGTVPMFTLYSMAAWGEANAAVLTNDMYMKPYWDGAKLLFQRLGMFNDGAIVHFEPDWWAYAQQQSKGDPSAMAAHVGSLAPDCVGQPDNLIGMGKCLVVLARKYAPKAVIGFHASEWADPDPVKVGQFLAKIGGAEADMLFVEMLDRDAGCFEAHTDPNCQRGGTTGWYMDETNKTSPNFREHLAHVSAVAKVLKKPLMWWQLPLGVPSTTPGGTKDHYRDNRVSYIFSHIDEFIAAGGVGAVFGVGAGNQTSTLTDGGQFKRAVTKYFQAPTPL
jgi:hypothetical protein